MFVLSDFADILHFAARCLLGTGRGQGKWTGNWA
jgi:hypothetical protein